jgi:hypothetical protein
MHRAISTLLASSLLWIGCAESSLTSGVPYDAGVDVPSREGTCTSSRECLVHNQQCLPSSSGLRTCQVPSNMGTCTPADVQNNDQCYPDARCQAVSTSESVTGGLCSFQAPAAPVFSFDLRVPKISVTAPDALTVLRPSDGIRLSWVPPAVSADTVVVAVVMKNVPQREGLSNRIGNLADVVWLWSSTTPGTATQPGNVPLEAGRQSVNADGSLGQPFATNLLTAGRYWWFVYALRNGVVVTASDVLNFRVGENFTRVECINVDNCTRQIPGELPDTVACINGQCRRRCASHFDCGGISNRCEMQMAIVDRGATQPPRGGYCVF